MEAYTDIILLALSTYGIATLLADYDGPFGVFMYLRREFRLMACAACMSVWVAAILGLYFEITLLNYMAIVGLALLMMRIEL